MPTTRRVLLGTAAISAAAAIGGGTAFALTREPARALEPWADAAGTAPADSRLRALAYAILAPNPHNRQPWLAELRGADEIVVRCDLERRLPETDPFDRQIVIGFGCFLELLRLAAAAQGRTAAIEPFPEGEPAQRLDGRPIARVRLTPAAGISSDPLFAHALARRSNKEPFDTARPVPADALAALRGTAGAGVALQVRDDPALVETLRDLTWRAFLTETGAPLAHGESVRLMRLGRREIEAAPDGIDIGGPVPEALRLVGLLTRDTLADPGSTAFGQMRSMYRAILGSGMAYAWLATAGNTRREQLAAGRDWLRLNLAATALGLALHPLSQALQEFPEMADMHAELRRTLGIPAGTTVQMLGRLGYGPEAPPSPRWPLPTRIRTA